MYAHARVKTKNTYKYILKIRGVSNALGDDGEDHPIFSTFSNFAQVHTLPGADFTAEFLKSKTASPLPLRKNSKKYQKIPKIRKSLVRGQSTPR